MALPVVLEVWVTGRRICPAQMFLAQMLVSPSRAWPGGSFLSFSITSFYGCGLNLLRRYEKKKQAYGGGWNPTGWFVEGLHLAVNLP